MSSAFELRFEWLDPGDMRDPALARTFARLEVRVGDVCVTTAIDRRGAALRRGTEVSLLPLASWAADAYWLACFEGRRIDRVRSLRRAPSAEERAWHRRHGWLAYREGFALPEVVFSRHDGDAVRIDWLADAPFEPMPLQFLEQGSAVVPRHTIQDELRRLVEGVLERGAGSEDGAMAALRSRWRAVTEADATDRLVCERAARLGLDAHDEADVSDATESLLAHPPPVADTVLLDLLNASERPSTAALATQLDEMAQLLARAAQTGGTASGPLESARLHGAEVTEAEPYQRGYARARALRRSLGIGDDVVAAPLDSALEELVPSSRLLERTFAAKAVHGLTARTREGGPFVALRPRAYRTGIRFDRARALYALLAFEEPRLVTASVDAEQQGARAFAAELLAPAASIRRMLGNPVVDADEVEQLADVLAVDPLLVRHQIENHDLARLAAW